MSYFRSYRTLAPGFALLALMLLGCGQKGPATATVSGTIKLNGEPVEGAVVLFQPVGEGRSSRGLTDANGRYTLTYTADQKGALIGEHIVSVSKSKKRIVDDNGNVVDPGEPEIFPPSANSQSELKANVVRGSNTFDFDIKN